MTLRNRHDRSVDHHGSLPSSSVAIEEIRLPLYPTGTSLNDVLASLMARLDPGPQTTHTFTLDATFRTTVEWQLIDLITIDAVIGSAVPETSTYPGHFKLNAVKYQGRSGSFTVDAVVA
jgi:hypothetical protein